MLPNRVFDVLPRAYSAVVQGLKDGIIVTDAAEKVVEINSAALEYFEEGAVGKTLEETLSKWPDLLQQIRSAPESQQEITIQVGNTIIPLGFAVSSLSNLQGDRTGTLIHFRDISRRVQTEADLERTQRDFYSVIEDFGDAYFEMDLAGRFTYVNQSLAKNSGYDRDELIGESYRKIFARESIRKVFDIFSEVIATGKPLERMDFEYVTRDKEKRHAELSVSVMRSGDGEIISTRGIVHDVTDLVQAEKAIREERDIAEHELEIGRQIQTGFFPTGLPNRTGWEISARF
jgi:PAS domain S-box-containing protein